jgi:carbonic anhydrase/acetyltransferase-like protein (isoleucine patch superfamily)
MIEQFGDLAPVIAADAWIHPSAVVLGDVRLGARVNVWPGVVLRGDQGVIEVGDETNLQDGTVAHATGDVSTVRIGARVTVGHRVILHGCQVADDVLVGMGSILLDNCRIGAWSIIGAGALVPAGMVVPEGVLVLGSPARVVRPLTDRDRAMIRNGHATYLGLAARHRAGG